MYIMNPFNAACLDEDLEKVKSLMNQYGELRFDESKEYKPEEEYLYDPNVAFNVSQYL